MPRRRSRSRLVAVAALVLLAWGLAGVHLRYPLPYSYRLLVYQESDFAEITLEQPVDVRSGARYESADDGERTEPVYLAAKRP